MQIRYHLVGIHNGFNSQSRRVIFQAVCEDCTWKGSAETDQEAAEQAATSHKDSGVVSRGLEPAAGVPPRRDGGGAPVSAVAVRSSG